jgi:hypothetical protein
MSSSSRSTMPSGRKRSPSKLPNASCKTQIVAWVCSWAAQLGLDSFAAIIEFVMLELLLSTRTASFGHLVSLVCTPTPSAHHLALIKQSLGPPWICIWLIVFVLRSSRKPRKCGSSCTYGRPRAYSSRLLGWKRKRSSNGQASETTWLKSVRQTIRSELSMSKLRDGFDPDYIQQLVPIVCPKCQLFQQVLCDLCSAPSKVRRQVMLLS